MGSVDRCDKTLPLNEMMYHVRRDPALRKGWQTDVAGLAHEFGLGAAEYEALRDKDVRRLHEIGVHQYYVPQILRLFFGASANSNAHPALEAYKRAHPEESARAAELHARHTRARRAPRARALGRLRAPMPPTPSPRPPRRFDAAPAAQQALALRTLGEMRTR